MTGLTGVLANGICKWVLISPNGSALVKIPIGTQLLILVGLKDIK
jgi:hypothetical protein